MLNNDNYKPTDPEEHYNKVYNAAINLKGKTEEQARRIAERSRDSAIKMNEENEKLRNSNFDGVDATGEKVNSSEKQYVAFDSNQIKSATGNNGNFSTEDNNVNRLAVMSSAFYDIETLFDTARLPNIVSAETAAMLLDGNIVSSKTLLNELEANDMFDDTNVKLAQLLQKHDIPVKLDNTIGHGTIAETVTT